MSETDSLLTGSSISDQGVYKRFGETRKHAIVFCVAMSSLVSLFPAGTFIPAIPDIVKDLDSTADIVTLAVSIFIITAALGNLFWATYSTYYGRRPIYIVATALLSIGSLGMATAHSIPSLFAWRVVQALGASAEVIGPGVIGDIYGTGRRGFVVGFYMGIMQLGPMLSPVVGGAVAHYSSWRTMQAALGIIAGALLLLIITTLPETIHPGERGLDHARAAGTDKARWVWLNPFGSFMLFRDPALLAVALAGACVMFTGYVVTVPLPYTVGKHYGITNETLTGAFLLPGGLGNLIGAPLAGRLSDMALRRARRRAHHHHHDDDYSSSSSSSTREDRLRATLVPAGVLVPGTVLAFGLVVQFVRGTPGIVLAAVILFLCGLGSIMVLTPATAYGVDVMGEQSAEITAASAGLRALLIALASPGVMPLVERKGVAFANAVAAVVAWAGFGSLVCTIRYGSRMRSWARGGGSDER